MLFYHNFNNNFLLSWIINNQRWLEDTLKMKFQIIMLTYRSIVLGHSERVKQPMEVTELRDKRVNKFFDIDGYYSSNRGLCWKDLRYLGDDIT